MNFGFFAVLTVLVTPPAFLLCPLLSREIALPERKQHSEELLSVPWDLDISGKDEMFERAGNRSCASTIASSALTSSNDAAPL